jgi:hypothetical protein
MKTKNTTTNRTKPLENHLTSVSNTEEEIKWMTRQEVMDYSRLGWWSIRTLIQENKLPVYGKYKNLLFKKVEVDAAIESMRVIVD